MVWLVENREDVSGRAEAGASGGGADLVRRSVLPPVVAHCKCHPRRRPCSPARTSSPAFLLLALPPPPQNASCAAPRHFTSSFAGNSLPPFAPSSFPQRLIAATLPRTGSEETYITTAVHNGGASDRETQDAPRARRLLPAGVRGPEIRAPHQGPRPRLQCALPPPSPSSSLRVVLVRVTLTSRVEQ